MFGGAKGVVEQHLEEAEDASHAPSQTAVDIREWQLGQRGDVPGDWRQQAQDQAARAFDMQTGLARLQPELASGLQKSLSGFGTQSQAQQQQVAETTSATRKDKNNRPIYRQHKLW